MNQKRRKPNGLQRSGKRLWNRVLDSFDLEDHELEVLEIAARALDRAMEARDQIADDGLTTKDRFGQIKPHPLLIAERNSCALALSALRDIGVITPKRKSGDDPDPSELDDFFGAESPANADQDRATN